MDSQTGNYSDNRTEALLRLNWRYTKGDLCINMDD